MNPDDKTKTDAKWSVLLRTVFEFNRIRHPPTGKGRRIVKIPRPFFLTGTASADTDAVICYQLSVMRFAFAHRYEFASQTL